MSATVSAVHCQTMLLIFIVSVLGCTLPVASGEAMKKVKTLKVHAENLFFLDYIFSLSHYQ